MKYMILRVNDEHSSTLCQKIEQLALQNGGLTFPFVVDGKSFDEATLKKGLNTETYRTELFHENCRCHLTPLAESLSISIKNNNRFDEIDRMMAIDSSLSHSATTTHNQKNPNMLITIKNKLILKYKQVVEYFKHKK